MEDFKDLRVWVKAYELTLGVYKKTRGFPKDEMYGLTSQLRRAASSVGANIAEGCGRRSDPEMRRFMQIVSRDLELLSVDDFNELEAMVLEIQRMLASFVQRLSVDVLAGSQ